jgi:hypothetical protein
MELNLMLACQKTCRDADTVIVPDLRASLRRIRTRRSKQQDRERLCVENKTAPEWSGMCFLCSDFIVTELVKQMKSSLPAFGVSSQRDCR